MNYSWKNKCRLLLRPVYIHFGFLRKVRQKYLRWRLISASKLESIINSSYNADALRALTDRRFGSANFFETVNLNEITIWPEIDVSTVSFNSSRWIKPFIASLFAQNYPLSKIHLRIVDHGSSDDTLAQIRGQLAAVEGSFASAQLIQQENLGFGAGHDCAIRTGSSKYCLVTNLDLEFLPNSLCEVVSAAMSDKAGAVASWELRQIPFEHPKYYDPVTLEANWSSHACVLIRRSAYLAVGGYDREIFMYAEDVELSYRFRSYGYILKYVSRAVVSHFTYESAGQIKPLQYSGSAIGNFYIRLRYGKKADQVAGFLLYAVRFLRPSPFPGAKSILLKNAWKTIGKIPHFVHGKGTAQVAFPLRGYDYEMKRDGAFFESQPSDILKNYPLVTIITRTYQGRGMFLRQAMQSVFNQTYSTIELIVVEDGGETQKELVESLSGRAPLGFRIRFLENEKLGRSAAGNAALAASEGRFVMFLDDDDLLFSDHVETLVAILLSDENFSAAYALAFEVHTSVSSDRTTYSEDYFHTPGLFRQEWDYEVLLDHNFIPIQAILFDRQLYEQRGGFDTELDQLEDWNLWLRYGFGNRFAYVPKTTSLFRSPTEFETRSARHGLLHLAYNDAKRRAASSLERLGLH